MQNKIPKLYYSISEVSEMTGLKQYVLRYWETEFPQLKPEKNSASNRKYKQNHRTILSGEKKYFNERFWSWFDNL